MIVFFFLLPNSKSQTLRRLLYLLGLLFVNNNMNMLCRCYADAEAIFFWWNLVSTPEALQIVSLLLPQKRQRQILIVFPWFPFDVQVKDFIKATVATIGYRYHLWNMFEPTSYFWSKCQMQKWVPKVRTLVWTLWWITSWRAWQARSTLGWREPSKFGSVGHESWV